MHHYSNSSSITGRRRRGSMDIQVGDTVVSHYRAHWTGVVLELNNGTATVRQQLDKRGVPIRKPRTVQYHCNWFTVTGRSVANSKEYRSL
jgi:hypothetical protein